MELGDEIRDIFFLECADLMAELHGKLAEVEQGGGDVEDLNAIFRAVHSVKGGAGSFDLPELVGFAHIFENVLDLLRSGKAEVDDPCTALLLQSADTLSDLVEWSQAGETIDPDAYAPALAKLEAFADDHAEDDGGEAEDFVFAPVSLGDSPGLPPLPGLPDLPGASDLPDLPGLPDLPSLPDLGASADTQGGFTLSFAPHADLYKSGLNSFRLLEELLAAGAQDLCVHDDALPDIADAEPDTLYLRWTMRFGSDVMREDVEDILFFAADKCTLDFSDGPSGQAGENSLPDLPDLPELPQPSLPPLAGTAEAPIPEIPEAIAPAQIPDKPARAEKADPGETAKQSGTSSRKAPPPTIRVVLDKIDRLINQVGELVITQAMLDESINEADLHRDPNIASTVKDFRQLTMDIQELVMAIRAQPIRSLFQRMGRVVRESAQKVDKSAKLVLEGEFTEVDNTIIESLADPLTHMLRNAVDHGLETPEGRVKAGKPEMGVVTLSAAHRGGKVVIEVIDDGAGVNREKVRAIAEEKGLVQPGAPMTDTEIDNILFMPGFSTADEVSTLSGRGVGMDVVKRSIQDVGGKVTIRSTPGEGSRITITLPLTLAILDGMLVQVGSEILVLPLTSVVETVLAPEGTIHRMGGTSTMVEVRGALLPMIDLGAHLGLPTKASGSGNVVVIVESDDHRWCALKVDAIIDQRQVVIKSLEENFGTVNSVSAATILGDGRLALILDAEQLSHLMVARTPTEDATQAREAAHG
ncbi:MAG: chemotaxis protein CheA [Pseudomonadota bacterium]